MPEFHDEIEEEEWAEHQAQEEHRMRRVVAKARERRAVDDLRHVLSEPAGRRVLWAFMSGTGLYEDPIETGQDVHAHAGGRRAGLRMRAAILEACDGDASTLAAMETEFLALPDIDPRTLGGVGGEESEGGFDG